jgi:ORF6N domain
MTKGVDSALASVTNRIIEARGQKVILVSDLAALYAVETRSLNQAMKRNSERFPPDFAFQLTFEEAEALRCSRSQSVTLTRGQNVKYRPWVFTEHGAIMAASVLNSPRAIEMSVYVVRAFVQLRDLARTHVELAKQLAALERRIAGHDEDLKTVLAGLRALLKPPGKPRPQIGFGRQGRP